MRKFIIILTFALLGAACEKDSLAVKDTPADNLVSNPELTGRLLRMAQNPTALDNVADNTSCFALQFPFTVIANGETVTVISAAGYAQIQAILDESNTDDDTVVLQFPVAVTYADYTEATFATQAQFDAAVANCTGSVELACMGLSYPLSIKTYNSKNQLAQTFSLAGKKALHSFLKDMAFYDAVSITYPVSFTTPNGAALAISSNAELDAAISQYMGQCPGGENPSGGLEELLVQGTWYVSYFFRDEDETSDYAAFDFTFFANGTASVSGGPNPITGTWNLYEDDGETEIEFTFTGSQLDEIEEDWTVTSVTATKIEMRKVSGGGDDIGHLHLTRN